LADISDIADQIVGAYDGDEDDIANFCIDLLAAVGLHEESDKVWEILLNSRNRTVTRESHIMVDATLDSINSDPQVVARLVQELLDDAGATDEQETEVWYVLRQRDSAEQETPLLRPAHVLTTARDRARIFPVWRTKSRRERTAKMDIYGYNLESAMDEARRWIPDEATWRDIEDYVDYGADAADIEIHTVSPGSQGIHQSQDAADEFGITLSQEDIEEGWDWEVVEERAAEIADALSEAAEAKGLPGYFYFGHNEADGSYGLRYRVDLADLPNVAVPASRGY